MSDLDDARTGSVWQRLTAADPAGPDPDLSALTSRLLAVPGAGVPGESDPDSAAGAVHAGASDHDDVPVGRPPVTQRLFALAAGVAVLAGVGVGGYVLGQRTSGADVVAGAPAEMLTQAEKSTDSAAGAAQDATTRVTPTAAAAPAPFAVEAPATLVGPELSGFSVSDAGIDRPALAAQLARTFGVIGDPVMLPSGDWVVGPGEGSNAVLVVGASAAVPWSMTNPAPPLPTGAALSEPRANEVARTILARLGVPVDEVEWEAVSVGGLVTETAWYVVDGERTPMFWRLAFDQSGEIVTATGFAGTLLPLAD